MSSATSTGAPTETDAAPPGGAGRLLAQMRARLRPHASSLVLLTLVLAVIGIVHATGMSTYPMRHDDEGTYVAQAWVYQQDFRLSHYTYWYDHPPVGWIALAAYNAATGAVERADHALAAGREAMLLVHLVASALLYVLCRRLGIGRGWALLALALFSFSPLALTYHRWVFLDNLAIPWLLASFVLALTPGRRLSAYAGAAVCFALAVLTKETMLLALPALLYQLWQNIDASNRRYAWTVFFSLLVLCGLLYPLYAVLRGELLPGPDHVSLWEAVVFHLAERSPEEPLNVIAGWRGLDGLLLGLGGAAAVPAALQRRLRPYVALVVVHVAVTFRPNGYLPDPYVIVLMVPAALLVAGVFDGLWRWQAFEGGQHRAHRFGARILDRAPAGLAIASVVALLAVLIPAWAPGIGTAMRADHDAPMRLAQAWVEDNVGHDERLLVENTMWVDLVRAGFPEEQVIWFYKLGLDPAIEEDLPDGWREFDYIVGTRLIVLMADILDVAELQQALENSETIAVWGEGPEAVEIRRIQAAERPETTRPIDRTELQPTTR